MVTAESPESVAYIQTIEVLPDYRGQGIGAELLRRLEDSAPRKAPVKSGFTSMPRMPPPSTFTSAAAIAQPGREEHYYARHRAAVVYLKA